jgi:hypothetical protein
MVKIWGRLARTAGCNCGLAAVAMSFVAAHAFSDFCGPRSRTFHDLSFGENAREWIAIRPQGGSNRGPGRSGEHMDGGKGLLGLPLV